MPELPSVEIFKKYFDSTSLNKEIDNVEVQNPEILINTTPEFLNNKLEGHEFKGSWRYGKYLFIDLDNSYYLVLHFGMNGYLKYFQEDSSPYIRLQVEFTNGYKLGFDDIRKFGKAWLISDPIKFIQEKNLGPDALEINFKSFKTLFKKKTGQIKPILMNQNFIAGIGNLYADEILYQSRIHPLSKANKLDKAKLYKLFQEMQWVLNKAIEYQDKIDSLPSSFLLPHRNLNGKCPKGEALNIIKVGGRTTYFCPERQKLF
ncbi:MAG TPA: DNA-formamidopyrimidine glycosylase family protein [Methanobacterium sp.]|nr:MAG: Fpg/Nei family DNA glycosylase [Methanobacterium sp.]HOI70647.1 DNA-formamidopyrimidine glycosylase family protein [Methanobacterium sp.]HPX78201.1 DNA-formamidopyrimidine glycosylase family protein [Methanobacterium sp.]